MEIMRKKFQGVLNILSFNRHFYYFGLGSLIILWVIFIFLDVPFLYQCLLLMGYSYGFLMPLIVSAYVYDFSGYYDLNWLQPFFEKVDNTTKVININAGFDETSHLIKYNFPQIQLQVFDFYDRDKHTEAAIVRARKVSNIYPGTQSVSTDEIPLEDNVVDYILMLSSVHEIRDFDEKVTFLKECHRVCRDDGKLIIVEHLRDISNFMAFTVGFTHFFSKKLWKRAFKEAGFYQVTEEKFTPFMSIFEVRK